MFPIHSATDNKRCILAVATVLLISVEGMNGSYILIRIIRNKRYFSEEIGRVERGDRRRVRKKSACAEGLALISSMNIV